MSKNLPSTRCYISNVSYICNANVFNYSIIHGNYQFNDKKAAHGCKSRDFSTMVECVSSDRLSFIHPKTF